MIQLSDASQSSRGGTTGTTPARILVVEDGLIMARDIERRLMTMGYRIAGVAATGEDAVRKAHDTCPDLVLMDVNLKGPIDGIQAAQQIRNVADIPIVYVTAYSDDATLRRARVTEPFGYVLKPFEERELRTIIEIALYRHEMDSRLRESEQRYRAITEMTPGFAYSVAVRPDGSLWTEWVAGEFESTGLPMQALCDMQHHVHPDDIPALKDRMHHLLSGRHDIAEYRIATTAGELRWWHDHARPHWDVAKHRIVRIMGTAQDITERKRAEQHVEAILSAQSAMDQQVRSHLHTYTRSLLGLLEILSTAKMRDGSVDAATLTGRLRQVFHVYDMVYGGKHATGFDRHLRTLTAESFKKHSSSRLTYRVEAEPIVLDAERAAGTLLILQELLENALHHAYPDGARGEVAVEFRKCSDGGMLLRVADRGIGLRKDVDPNKPKTAGFTLVHHLVKHLKGALECERGAGTAISITIPSHA